MVWNPRLPSPRILVSSSADRRSPVALDGALVATSVAVFVPAQPDIESVEFLLDGQRTRIERFAPYDLNGTTADGRARLLELAPGQHRVVARITFTDDTTQEVTAVFRRT
jgi:hypothetical protein